MRARWTAIPLFLMAFGLLYLLFGTSSKEVDELPESQELPQRVVAQPVPAAIESTERDKELDINLESLPRYREVEKDVLQQCLRNTSRDDIPEIAADKQRLEPYMTRTSSLVDYRGQGRQQLESLAAQGDSVAMAVLATQFELDALGITGVEPSDYLMNEVPVVGNEANFSELDPETRRNLESAAFWFREAALHGRYTALAEVGRLYYLYGKDAVSLGWISEAEFDEVANEDKWQWSPYIAYVEMVVSLTSDAWTGPNGDLAEIDGFFSRDAQSQVVDQLLNQFFEEVTARGLPIQTVEPWQGRSLPEILEDVCPDIILVAPEPG
ncbi:MAG: hypothetical protein AAGA33_10790 [Pseudomonadota bacterium]